MSGSKFAAKNSWTLVLLILAGVIIGGFIGEFLGGLPYLGWLRYGRDFGLESPVTLELGIVRMQFGLMLRFTIAGIIGIALAIFAYRKL